MSRVVVWFSCGAASAVASKLAIAEYGDRCEIVYCDTGSEHPDNDRFLLDVEKWLGKKITILKSEKYSDIWDVFDKTRYLAGVNGARCTTELKKKLRIQFQDLDDLQIFGYTAEEEARAKQFENNNPELLTEWILIKNGVSKDDCLAIIAASNIEIPAMYKLGYRNNNCIGCVKGGAGYWNKIRVDFPDVFERMAKVERKLNVAINKSYAGDGKRKRVFLDELDPSAGRYSSEADISCGIGCGVVLDKINEDSC